jgi:hypothetical protein
MPKDSMSDAMDRTEAYLKQRKRERQMADAAPDLLAALKLFIEELDDPCRRMPLCEWDQFAQAWKQNPNFHTVQLSLVLEKMVRAAIAKATGG